MKNKQINKFLLMFFLSFTLFFSVSNAEFSSSPISSSIGFSSSEISYDSFLDSGYSTESIRNIINNYFRNLDNEDYLLAFDTLVDTMYSHGYYTVVNTKTSSGFVYPTAYFVGTNVSVGCGLQNTKDKIVFTCINNTEDLNNTFSYISNNSSSSAALGYLGNLEPNKFALSNINDFAYSNVNIKQLTYSGGWIWDGESYYYESASSGEEDNSALTDEEFTTMLNEITTSELFYQHISSDYRSNFYVQYDVNAGNYLFYFYPSNYQVNGLRRNENDYHILCDKDFSWWDNVVDFLKRTFTRETENLDYEMIYMKVQEDGTYSCWYRSKSMLSVDETLFNFDLNPIVYSSVEIPFYGQHGGGGIDIDSGDKTIATEPEYIVNEQVYGESNIVYNPTPVEKVSGEQDFWDKVVNRLSSVVSYVKDIPSNIVNKLLEINGFTFLISFVSPLVSAILMIIGVLISSIALISRAVTFIYTLLTIEASSALFRVDVAETTNGLSFVGNNWGTRFLEGLDMLRNFSWNGLNLWNLFSAFIAAMFAIQVVKYIRKHYHY